MPVFISPVNLPPTSSIAGAPLSVNNLTVPVVPNYIEEVFSTWLYTGNDPSTQDIINGIDLSTKGGMVWQKARSSVGDNVVTDTVRGLSGGRGKELYTNTTGAENVDSGVTAFYTNGFRAGANGPTNGSGKSIASWTFRKQPKFMDIVTYTGTGLATTVAHNLNATVGFMLIKCTSQGGGWVVYHRSVSPAQYLFLQTTGAATAGSGVSTPAKYWNSTAPTSTVFSLGDSALTNESGQTYVAYLFAHDAGGFGLTGTDNVVSCGSFTTDGSGNATVNLGYEAQWVLMKKSSGAESWMLFDNMRGLLVTQGPAYSKKLVPNLTDAESDGDECRASSTGFNVGGVVGGATYIYVAIRRGPMKVPTSGTSVFSPQTSYSVQTIGGTSYAVVTPSFPVDTYFWTKQSTAENKFLTARLLGASDGLTNTEDSFSNNLASYWTSNTQVAQSASTTGNQIYECFRRAPSFHDVVCYTGTGSATTFTHNLGVTPELIIVKSRSNVSAWTIYSSSVGNTKALFFTNDAPATNTYWNNTTPTSSVFSVGTLSGVNSSGRTYIAYLFATCAGVSKVGSYTGTATTKQIDCGFTAGARFEHGVNLRQGDLTVPCRRLR